MRYLGLWAERNEVRGVPAQWRGAPTYVPLFSACAEVLTRGAVRRDAPVAGPRAHGGQQPADRRGRRLRLRDLLRRDPHARRVAVAAHGRRRRAALCAECVPPFCRPTHADARRAEEDRRPPLPLTRASTPGVAELLRVCWHRDPCARPAFARVARDVGRLRASAGAPSREEALSPPPLDGRLDHASQLPSSACECLCLSRAAAYGP